MSDNTVTSSFDNTIKVDSDLNELFKIKATKEELAYAAGIIDGEGCIHMGKTHREGKIHPSYAIRIKVNMTNPEPPKMLCKIFGGSLRLLILKNPKYKNQYQWDCSGRLDMLKCLSVIEPLLRVKRLQAQLAIDYIMNVSNNERTPDLRLQYYNKMRELNK